MPNLRTARRRAWRREGPSLAFLDTFEVGGKKAEELLLIQNGRARRHSPKSGVPPHYRADGADGDEWTWVEPKGRE